MFRRRKPNYETIALLERELGLTDEALQQVVDERKRSPDWKEKGGAVELPPSFPRRFPPGAVLSVDHKRRMEHAMMYPAHASSVSIPTTVVVRG